MQLLWELAEIVLYNDEVLDREWQEQSTSLYNFFFFVGSGSKKTARFPP